MREAAEKQSNTRRVAIDRSLILTRCARLQLYGSSRLLARRPAQSRSQPEPNSLNLYRQVVRKVAPALDNDPDAEGVLPGSVATIAAHRASAA